MQKSFMKGIELAEKFYLAHGLPMLRTQFADVLPLLAVGLVGSGSECLGYDDHLSKDHDFEAGFCIFLPDEDVVDTRTAFRLERAYAKLPKEFMGIKRPSLSPVGGNRHGVIRIADFLMARTGTADGQLSLSDWFSLPEQMLLETVGGKVFCDAYGMLTAARERLACFPEDVRLKKLAGELLTMGQTGQYNYDRCLRRGDTAAAQLAVVEFVKSAMHAAFLINNRYMPYYKWRFRAFSKLPMLSALYQPMEYLLSSGNSNAEAEEKKAAMAHILTEVIRFSPSSYTGTEAEGHAYAVNDRIKDATVRSFHILYGVS